MRSCKSYVLFLMSQVKVQDTYCILQWRTAYAAYEHEGGLDTQVPIKLWTVVLNLVSIPTKHRQNTCCNQIRTSFLSRPQSESTLAGYRIKVNIFLESPLFPICSGCGKNPNKKLLQQWHILFGLISMSWALSRWKYSVISTISQEYSLMSVLCCCS